MALMEATPTRSEPEAVKALKKRTLTNARLQRLGDVWPALIGRLDQRIRRRLEGSHNVWLRKRDTARECSQHKGHKPFLMRLIQERGDCQHLNDHWDLDHPFERILVDTAVAPDPSQVSWINPRLQPGETRRVVTGIPGKTGVVYTLNRATGEFLWATPTVLQNVISGIDGATGAVTENAEVTFTAVGQQVFACPTWNGGKDWESVYTF